MPFSKSTFLTLTPVFFALSSSPSKAEPSKTPVVFVQELKPTEIADTLIYPVRVTAQSQANILADFDGQVESVKVQLGQTVRKGQALAVMRNTDPVFEYAPVNLIASINGRVGSIDVITGSRVTRGQKIVGLVDSSRIKLTMEVPAADLTALSVGAKGSLRAPGHDEAIPVQVVGISPSIDSATGTAPAELSVLQASRSVVNVLPIGVLLRATFSSHAHLGLEIPENAIVYKDQKTFVRIVEKGVAHLRPVTVSSPRRGMVEISKGLNAGQLVIVRTSAFVAEGDSVTIQNLEVARK